MTKRALITGITRDGSTSPNSCLRRTTTSLGWFADRARSTLSARSPGPHHLRPRRPARRDLDIHILREFRPQEVYNLAAQSFVQTSFGQPVLTVKPLRGSHGCSMPSARRS